MKYILVLLISVLSTACVPQYAIQKSLLTVYNATNVNSTETPTEDCKFSFVEGDIEHNRLEIRRIMSDRLIGNMGYMEAMELADKISDKFKDNPSEFELKYRRYVCGE